MPGARTFLLLAVCAGALSACKDDGGGPGLGAKPKVAAVCGAADSSAVPQAVFVSTTGPGGGGAGRVWRPGRHGGAGGTAGAAGAGGNAGSSCTLYDASVDIGWGGRAAPVALSGGLAEPGVGGVCAGFGASGGTGGTGGAGGADGCNWTTIPEWSRFTQAGGPVRTTMTNHELESVISQKMKDGVIPGAVVLIEKGGEGRWLQAFGTSTEGVPVRTDDYFRVGSNTKTMTATVILQLMQEGKLGLDDPVSKYISGVPNGDAITIAQLLGMRSGLPNYTYDPAFVKQPQKVWQPQELLALSFAKPVDFAPGARFEYSNANYIVLGLIIEKLTGMSAPDALRKRIFEPLGLGHTSLPALTDHTIPGPHAHGYMYLTDKSTLEDIALTPQQKAAAQAGTLEPSDVSDWNPSPGWTAGSAISTAEDMALYTKKLVGGGLLDAKTQQLRLDSIRPADPGKPQGSGYGLGLSRFAPNLIGHNGQIAGYVSFAAYDPKLDLLVIILTNLYETPAGKDPAIEILLPVLAHYAAPPH